VPRKSCRCLLSPPFWISRCARRTAMASLVGATCQDGATLGNGFTVWNSRAATSTGRKVAQRPHVRRMVVRFGRRPARASVWSTWMAYTALGAPRREPSRTAIPRTTLRPQKLTDRVVKEGKLPCSEALSDAMPSLWEVRAVTYECNPSVIPYSQRNGSK
jgi:hypothetical protein